MSTCLNELASQWTIVEAEREAWDSLARYHYRNGRLPPVDKIFAIVQQQTEKSPDERLLAERKFRAAERLTYIGVIVYAYPVPNLAIRNRVLDFRYRGMSRPGALRQLNRECRTIARVVIHPQFRGMGLATWLVGRTLAHIPVPYIESLAVMGRIHPFFARAGMTPYQVSPGRKAVRLINTLSKAGMTQKEYADVDGFLNRLRGLSTDYQQSVRNELVRYVQSLAHSKFRKENVNKVNEPLVRKALTHVFNKPVYYLWNNQMQQAKGAKPC